MDRGGKKKGMTGADKAVEELRSQPKRPPRHVRPRSEFVPD